MAWESQLAPFDQPHVPGWQGQAAPAPLPPGEIEPRVAQMQARQIDANQKKAVVAAQAAKVAADNAVRAAVAGAPTVAATNAATAQAAANVAAGVATTAKAQRAAAVAQSEATKAVAAANVAANNANGQAHGWAHGRAHGRGHGRAHGRGMNDWMELSGMSGITDTLESNLVGGVKLKHVLYGVGALGVGYFGVRWWKNRKKG